MPTFRRWPFIVLLVAASGFPLASLRSATTPDVLLDTMRQELHRAEEALAKSDPATYYLSYSVSDATAITIAGSTGSLIISNQAHRRVGRRDDARRLTGTGQYAQPKPPFRNRLRLLFRSTTIRDAIARVLWQLTNREYRAGLLSIRESENQSGRAIRGRRQVS